MIDLVTILSVYFGWCFLVTWIYTKRLEEDIRELIKSRKVAEDYSWKHKTGEQVEMKTFKAWDTKDKIFIDEIGFGSRGLWIAKLKRNNKMRYVPGDDFKEKLSKDTFAQLMKTNNIYVACYGLVSYSEKTLVNRNNLFAGLDTLTDTVSDYFTVSNLNKFMQYILELGLVPKNGKKEFAIEACYDQILQLLRDPEIMNYWKIRAELAEAYIDKMPKHDALIGERWKADQKYRNSKHRSISGLLTDYNIIKKSKNGSMRVCGFVIHEKTNKFDAAGRRFARLLDNKGINPLLVTYSPSY